MVFIYASVFLVYFNLVNSEANHGFKLDSPVNSTSNLTNTENGLDGPGSSSDVTEEITDSINYHDTDYNYDDRYEIAECDECEDLDMKTLPADMKSNYLRTSIDLSADSDDSEEYNNALIEAHKPGIVSRAVNFGSSKNSLRKYILYWCTGSILSQRCTISCRISVLTVCTVTEECSKGLVKDLKKYCRRVCKDKFDGDEYEYDDWPEGLQPWYPQPTTTTKWPYHSPKPTTKHDWYYLPPHTLSTYRPGDYGATKPKRHH